MNGDAMSQARPASLQVWEAETTSLQVWEAEI